IWPGFLATWNLRPRNRQPADGLAITANRVHNLAGLPWVISSQDDSKAFLYEMAVVGQDLRNPLATHRRHGYAVHKTVTLVIALLVHAQARQKGSARLRMNRHTPVVKDSTDRPSGSLPQMCAALS